MSLAMYFISLILIGVLLGSINSQMSFNKRVIGGEIAPTDKFRWAVSLKVDVDAFRDAGSCGASIINTKGSIKWMLTAAHCFYPDVGSTTLNLTKPSLWHARIGLRKVDFLYKKHGLVYKVRQGLQKFFRKAFKKLFNHKVTNSTFGDVHVKKIFVHPSYDPNRLEYDIALMKLKDSLPEELKGVNTIDLPPLALSKNWPEEDTKCDIVGWGCTVVNGDQSPDAKLASLTVWNNKKCIKAFVDPIDLNDKHEFCAGYRKKTYGLCPGDSGSGLACKLNDKWTIAGVVSAAHAEEPGEYPAVFTRISWFSDWIVDIIKNN